MPKIKFMNTNFGSARLELIKTCNEIIATYIAQGFRLTLRQLYYQLVSRDVIPNKQTAYDSLGETVNCARLAGLIDWEAIEDRTRNFEILSHWSTPESIIESAARSYRRDLWANQHCRVEVWVEKDALEGVIASACVPLDTPYFSCRGYTSQTAMYDAGMRMCQYLRDEQTPIVIHLGDHDPSGIDMTRDIRERLEMFAGEPIDVRRIALNMDQIEQYQPPPNPAKHTDSRYRAYVDEYGDESWELDALEPTVLVDLIRRAIAEVREHDAWHEALTEQETQRAELHALSEQYTECIGLVRDSIIEPEVADDGLRDLE